MMSTMFIMPSASVTPAPFTRFTNGPRQSQIVVKGFSIFTLFFSDGKVRKQVCQIPSKVKEKHIKKDNPFKHVIEWIGYA